MTRQVIVTSAANLLPMLSSRDCKHVDLIQVLEENPTSRVFQCVSEGQTTAIALCTRRTWDTQFFGVDISTLNTFMMKEEPDNPLYLDECVTSAVQDALSNNTECVFSRVNMEHLEVIRTLERIGFRIYDIGCTFLRIKSNDEIDGSSYTNESISEAIESDVWELVSLASRVFTLDHFHQDVRIGNEAADAMHGQWIRNSFYDDSCRVFVYRESGNITGFLCIQGVKAVKKSANGTYVITLVGVAENQRKSGIGGKLITYAMDHVESGSQVKVGTQASNVGAIALYLQKGFVPTGFHVTTHLWRDDIRLSRLKD